MIVVPEIDSSLADYYYSVVAKHNGRKETFINQVNNGLMIYYYQNKDLFRVDALLLRQKFTSDITTRMKIKLSEINLEFFRFMHQSSNRLAKHQAEFMLTCIFMTLQAKKIDEIRITAKGDVSFYCKNRLYHLK